MLTQDLNNLIDTAEDKASDRSWTPKAWFDFVVGLRDVADRLACLERMAIHTSNACGDNIVHLNQVIENGGQTRGN